MWGEQFSPAVSTLEPQDNYCKTYHQSFRQSSRKYTTHFSVCFKNGNIGCIIFHSYLFSPSVVWCLSIIMKCLLGHEIMSFWYLTVPLVSGGWWCSSQTNEIFWVLQSSPVKTNNSTIGEKSGKHTLTFGIWAVMWPIPLDTKKRFCSLFLLLHRLGRVLWNPQNILLAPLFACATDKGLCFARHVMELNVSTAGSIFGQYIRAVYSSWTHVRRSKPDQI